MGCKASAIATDILLLASEFRMFSGIKSMQRLHVIKRFIRFRDDVNTRLKGEPEEICSVLKTITTKYPGSIDFNIKVTFLNNTFLNLRTYVLPKQTRLDLSVLRKAHDRHDIVRSDSKTNPRYVGAAIRTAATTALTCTSNQFHLKHQFQVYGEILLHKGYTQQEFKSRVISTKMKLKLNKRSKFNFNKPYGGKIIYDSLTHINNYIIKLLKMSGMPDTISLPLSVGSKKVNQYVFSKNKFYKKLKLLHETNL